MCNYIRESFERNSYSFILWSVDWLVGWINRYDFFSLHCVHGHTVYEWLSFVHSVQREANGEFPFNSDWVSIITYCEWNSNKWNHTRKTENWIERKKALYKSTLVRNSVQYIQLGNLHSFEYMLNVEYTIIFIYSIQDFVGSGWWLRIAVAIRFVISTRNHFHWHANHHTNPCFIISILFFFILSSFAFFRHWFLCHSFFFCCFILFFNFRQFPLYSVMEVFLTLKTTSFIPWINLISDECWALSVEHSVHFRFGLSFRFQTIWGKNITIKFASRKTDKHRTPICTLKSLIESHLNWIERIRLHNDMHSIYSNSSAQNHLLFRTPLNGLNETYLNDLSMDFRRLFFFAFVSNIW